MTNQLSLFPENTLQESKDLSAAELFDLEAEINAIDEIFVTSPRYRSRREYLQLLNYIARFPKYSTYNCFLLYSQNPAASYVATARIWARKFRRRPKYDARPLVILAPMSPVLFVFDLSDTEGDPVSPDSMKPYDTTDKLAGKIYENTLHNCDVQGIEVRVTFFEDHDDDTSFRITPAVRKKYGNLELKKDASYLIMLNSELRREEKYSSLVYELGHIFCGHLGIDRNAWWLERKGIDVRQEEIEAESVAYLVCRRKGLNRVSEKYLVADREKEQEIPVFSLNSVFLATNYIEEMGKLRWKKPKKKSRY